MRQGFWNPKCGFYCYKPIDSLAGEGKTSEKNSEIVVELI